MLINTSVSFPQIKTFTFSIRYTSSILRQLLHNILHGWLFFISLSLKAKFTGSDRCPRYKTWCEKTCITKPCSTIKVTHIPGFITIKTYANVAVSPMGTRARYMPRFCTGPSSIINKTIKRWMPCGRRLEWRVLF